MQKYPPKGDWRRFDKQKISYTKLIKICSYSLSKKKVETWDFCLMRNKRNNDKETEIRQL